MWNSLPETVVSVPTGLNSFKSRLDRMIWKSHMCEESEEWYSNSHSCKRTDLAPVQNESEEVEEDMFNDDSNDRHKGVLA